MNKYALILETECNEVFRGMSNVVFFKGEADFKRKLVALLAQQPQYEQHRKRFSWDCANQEFYRYLMTRL